MHLTPEQYLAIEDAAEYKSEYFQGEMFAISGATSNHNGIAANVIAEFRDQLRRHPCHVRTSDQRIHIPRTGLFTYPDAVVTCGEMQFLDQQMTLLNPTVIVEILSPSTEAYDRGRKFEHYQSVESLREYLLVASDRISATIFRRQAGVGWLSITTTESDSVIELESIGCRLVLRDLYEKVEISAAQDLL